MFDLQSQRRGVLQAAARSALALAAGSIVPAWGRGSGAPLPRIGSTLSLPDLTLLDGTAWRAAQVDQKTLVVYWWASWCPFCAVQSPHMEALWQAQKAHGLALLALSIDNKPAAASAYMKAKRYSFPAAMLTPQVAKSLAKPAGLPVVVVVVLKVKGHQGRVVFAESGEMFPEDVEGLKKYI